MPVTVRPAYTAKVTPEFVRGLRDHLGESMSRFSRRFGVDKGQIWRWEAGRQKPNEAHRRTMLRLAQDNFYSQGQQ